VPVSGQRAKFLDSLGIAIRGHTAPVLLSPHIDASSMRVEEGHMFGHGLVLLACLGHMFLPSGAERREQGKTALLLRKDTLRGGARRAARLFHLERTNAERWRDANMAVERTGHTTGFLSRRVSVGCGPPLTAGVCAVHAVMLGSASLLSR
jgi:hypothetical protein